MTAPSHPSRAGDIGARLRVLVAPDGAVAATALTVFQYFLVSVSFIGCLGPAVAFTLLVGWQPTHLALWLGAASLLPLTPATYALLRGSRRLLSERSEAQAGRVFWSSFVDGCRSLAWAAGMFTALLLLLAYDLALFGGSDAMLLFVAAVGAFAVVLLIATCAVAAADPERRPIDTITRAVRAVGRRPHVGLSWLLLIGLGGVAASLPVVGAGVVLFLPAVVGVLIHICNDALRLPLIDETRPSS
jgi:hypothetical protein